MKPAQLDAWRHRPLEVIVRDLCPHCNTLQPNVIKRQNYWPSVTAVACEPCFTRLINECSGLAVC